MEKLGPKKRPHKVTPVLEEKFNENSIVIQLIQEFNDSILQKQQEYDYKLNSPETWDKPSKGLLLEFLRRFLSDNKRG